MREAAKLAPASWTTQCNLVRGLRRAAKVASLPAETQRQIDVEICSALEEMSRQRPKEPNLFYRLGMSLAGLERKADAVSALERNLAAFQQAQASADDPSKESLPQKWRIPQTRHWLAVLKGETPSTAPSEYVAGLFDSYAENFEEHLVQQLHYNTPALLAKHLRSVVSQQVASWRRCADLGCGTGLMGPPLRRLGFRGRLEGVDLSEGMLLKALDKGGPGVGYQRLLCGDLADIFTPLAAEASGLPGVERPAGDATNDPVDEASCFDLVIAADVFVYLGDLAPIFRRTAAWLRREGGVFAFSTEAMEEGSGPYKLASTGRYVHTQSYVSTLATELGFEVLGCHAETLRMNAGKPVRGHIHVLALS